MWVHFWKMRESLGIAISEACGIKTMKCELIYVLKEYKSKVCTPPWFSHFFLWKLQTVTSGNQCHLNEQMVINIKVF